MKGAHKKMELMGLSDLLEQESPKEFDFRNLMWNYYQYYYKTKPKNRKGNPKYETLLKEAKKIEDEPDPIIKWYLYKTADESWNNPFDCDNSRTTCQMASEIYKTLWGEEILGFCTRIGTPSGEQKETFVGDTMNSILTTLNELAKSERREKWWSWERWKELYHEDEDHKEFKQIFAACPQVRDFVRVAHTIGNFLPWPVGCNAPRGMSPQIKDYWDLTLDCIYWWYQKSREWLKERPQFPQNDMIVGLLDSQMVNFDQYLAAFGSWDNFIKANYMQPFVYTKEGCDVPENWPGPFGRPKELWEGHFAKATPVLPVGDEIFKYFENAAKWIQDRSALMVAALRDLQTGEGK